MSTPPPYRVLVTGSRAWIWPLTIFDALEDVRAGREDTLTIIHGACSRGADAIADQWAIRSGVPVERYPADWSQGRHAGMFRNALMVDTMPARCLAFIRDSSPGASGCARLAELRGIPTLRFERSS